MSFTKNVSLTTKRMLLGAVFPRYSRLLDVLNRNALLNSWVQENADVPQFDERSDYFRFVHDVICGGGAIDYLEFGVASGESIKQWSELNTNTQSRMYGFDTFAGLPEDWDYVFGGLGKGTFDQHGKVPATSDNRLKFIPGLFQDSLDGFLAGWKPSAERRLVVHVDSDLYSAALYVLTKLDSYLVPGSVVMFDDFYNPLHDFRAFCDYAKAYQRQFTTVAGASGNFKSAAFVRA